MKLASFHNVILDLLCMLSVVRFAKEVRRRGALFVAIAQNTLIKQFESCHKEFQPYLEGG